MTSSSQTTLDKVIYTLIRKFGYNLVLNRVLNISQNIQLSSEALHPEYPRTVLLSVNLDIVAEPASLHVYKQIQSDHSGMGADYIPFDESKSRLDNEVYLEKDMLGNLVIIHP